MFAFRPMSSLQFLAREKFLSEISAFVSQAEFDMQVAVVCRGKRNILWKVERLHTRGQNMLTYSLAEVYPDLLYFNTLEDEVAEMQHFLVEPEYNRDYLDGAASLEPMSQLMDFDFGIFSGAFKHEEIKFCNDASNLIPTPGEAEANTEVSVAESDRWQDDNEKILHGNFVVQPMPMETVNDVGPAHELTVLDNVSEKDSTGNIALESHFPHFLEEDCGTAEKPDWPSEISMVHESKGGKNPPLMDRLTIQGLRGVTRISAHKQCTRDSKRIVEQIHVKKERFVDSDGLECTTSSFLVKDVGFCLTDKTKAAAALVTERKKLKSARTRRSGAGLFVQKPRHHNILPETCYKNSRNMLLTFGSSEKHFHKEFGAAKLVLQGESLEGSYFPASCGSPAQKGQLENGSFLDNDSEVVEENRGSYSDKDSDAEHSSAESKEQEFVTRTNGPGGGKRMHHSRRWTPSETKKLIEGVSRCGVGKWKCIKKLMFPSSCLTPMQLKDKWRNLLKASCKKTPRKIKNMRGAKRGSHQLPESAMCRVRELAGVDTYT